jgi:Mrr N-terminal domain
MPLIEIHDETFAELQRRAVPLVDTPDSVIRVLLGLDPLPANGNPPGAVVDRAGPLPSATAARPAVPSGGPRQARAARQRSGKRERAPRGSLLEEAAYELPILQILEAHNGEAPKNTVLDELEPMIASQLKPADHQPYEQGGEPRWRKRAQFVRLRLIERHEMERGERGVWTIAEGGRERLRGEGMPVG